MEKKNEKPGKVKAARITKDGSINTVSVDEKKEQKKAERAEKKQKRKEKRAQFRQKARRFEQAYGKRIWDGFVLLIMIALLIVFIRWIVMIIIGGVILMAVGGGISDSGEQTLRQNEQNRRRQDVRDGKPPRYWR